MVDEGKQPGLAETQYNLAYMYEKGKGTPKDMSAAATIRSGGGRGLVHAQFTIAGMYDKGRGVVQNYSAAQSGTRRLRNKATATPSNI